MINYGDIYKILPYFTKIDESNVKGSFLNQHIAFSVTDDVIFDAAIIGLPDDESRNEYSGANQIRKELSGLSALSKNFNILDLGNLKYHSSYNENITRVVNIIGTLQKYGLKIIIAGGNSAFITKTIYDYFRIEQVPLNLVSLNSVIEWDQLPVDPLTIHPVNSVHENQINFINIGYQNYLVEKEILNFIQDAHFEAYRLGLVRNNIMNYEPMVRDANVLSISMNAVKFADAPASKRSSPNGLSGDEICQFAYFGGFSSRVNIFILADIDPALDIRNTTSLLAAQALWHVCDGFTNNIIEDPLLASDNLTKYHIHLEITNQDLAFYYSNITKRWWMEVTIENKRKILVSCTQDDYELSCNQEIPERWWRLFNRIDN